MSSPGQPAPTPDDLVRMRALAADWYTGSASALYGFASTGTLECTPQRDQRDYVREVNRALVAVTTRPGNFANPAGAEADLRALRKFFYVHAQELDSDPQTQEPPTPPQGPPPAGTAYAPGAGQWGVFDVDEGLMRVEETFAGAREWAVGYVEATTWRRHHAAGTRLYEYVFVMGGEITGNLFVVALDDAARYGFDPHPAPRYPSGEHRYEEAG